MTDDRGRPVPDIDGHVDERGTPIRDVPVEIDYAIIEHFSKHLYGSPNKAVEELVSNSFDALASSVYVYVPGVFTEDQVLVWDDGESMGVENLHRLWWIAQSPKDDGAQRIAESEDGKRKRQMIGKFGIGKLASYAVGHRLTHLCRRSERFLRVSVDYKRIPHIQDLEEGAERQTPRTSMIELSEEEAREYVLSLFNEEPDAMSKIWDGEHWTLAIVDQLKEDVHLTEGRLGWVIGNGMPLRPDFKVWVNDKSVQSKLARGARASWDVYELKVREKFAAEWEAAQRDGRVSGGYSFVPASARPNNVAALRVPALGEVEANVHFFDQSQRNGKSNEARSYGFFVMVRGRLLNSEDALLSMSDPSYGTFYRCQYVIEADGLDEDLLADRERLHLQTPRTVEFAILRDALYRASRQALEEYDAQTEKERRSESLLPVDSREYFREPLTALLLNRQETPALPFDVDSLARIERVSFAQTDPISKMDYENGGFQVNLTHPLLKAVQDKIGDTKGAREAMRALDLFAISERLFEGFLYDVGVPDEQIARIVRWRDDLLRVMALRYDAAPAEEVVSEVREASYKGSKAFEDALAKLFRLMGFEASRDGAKGRKDILVVAPIGIDEYRFTVEAKGKNVPKPKKTKNTATSKNGPEPGVENDAAEVSAAAAHRDDVEANLAIVVARKFNGFERQGEEPPAILKECRSTGGVSIATIDVLADLLDAVRTYHYPLDIILPLLEVIESPEEKLNRVRSLSHPTDGFDFRGVLEKLWELQQDDAHGDIVPYRTLWHLGPNRWDSPTLEHFERRLQALETLSSYLLRVVENEKSVFMRQSPEIVASCIQHAVESQKNPEQDSGTGTELS